MTEEPPNPSNLPNPFHDSKPVVGQYSHAPVTARVPDRVARAVYSTGQLVLDSPKEFMIDFLNGLTRPYQVVARVVMTPATMSEFTSALQTNLDRYQSVFGPPPTLMPPPTPQKPTIQEIYENFKISDEMLSGAYANSVLIGHSQTEFFFDFIAGFYPTSAVAARVLLAASHVPRFLSTLSTALQQYQSRYNRRDSGSEPPAAST